MLSQDYESSSSNAWETFTDAPETEDEKACRYLDSVRTNYTVCCQYPVLVVWKWQYDECLKKCTQKGHSFNHCCVFPCCFNKLGVLKVIYADDGNVTSVDVDWRGPVYSFMLSIGNDTRWEPLLNSVVGRCNEQFGGTDGSLHCGEIPNSLFDVIDCCYKQNFLQCPTWNPFLIPECQYTFDFVSKCTW